MELILVAGILAALVFNFMNGMNDAANSIATVVATRVLSPLQAVGMATFFNLVGPFLFTTAIAKTIGKGIVDPSVLTPAILTIGVVAAIAWVWVCTRYGLPISATHALVGGLIGSAIAVHGTGVVILPPPETVEALIAWCVAGGAAGAALLSLAAAMKGEPWRDYLGMGALMGVALTLPFLFITGILRFSGILAIVVFIVVSPVLGFIAAFLLGLAVTRRFARERSQRLSGTFRHLQVFSASFYSIGHGSNDAQNAMGIITAILVAGGILADFTVPPLVIVTSCLAISLGTAMGGWRVIETMGKKITHLQPYQGFCAESSGGVVLAFVTAFGVPVSTTHAISGAVMGVGASRGYSAVKWGVVREIVGAWVLTIPLAIAIGWATGSAIHVLAGLAGL